MRNVAKNLYAKTCALFETLAGEGAKGVCALLKPLTPDVVAFSPVKGTLEFEARANASAQSFEVLEETLLVTRAGRLLALEVGHYFDYEHPHPHGRIVRTVSFNVLPLTLLARAGLLECFKLVWRYFGAPTLLPEQSSGKRPGPFEPAPAKEALERGIAEVCPVASEGAAAVVEPDAKVLLDDQFSLQLPIKLKADPSAPLKAFECLGKLWALEAKTEYSRR